MTNFVTHGDLELLTELWHGGCWSDLELEDVIRAVTDWTHLDFDRWLATGAMPGDSISIPEQNWCGCRVEVPSQRLLADEGVITIAGPSEVTREAS